jgi:hypothetical protein
LPPSLLAQAEDLRNAAEAGMTVLCAVSKNRAKDAMRRW